MERRRISLRRNGLRLYLSPSPFPLLAQDFTLSFFTNLAYTISLFNFYFY